MDPNLLHRNNLENMDLSQFQGDTTKLNPSVLRGIEGSTLHFITIPRNPENEYIDHALLSPEYITAHIQNGLVVDIIQSQHDQQGVIASHNIYNNNEQIDQNASPLEMTTDRHFIANNDVSMPIESIQHSLHSNHSSMQPAEHLNHRNHFESATSMSGEDRKVIIGEPGRQYILPNEAPVIVSNKEAAAMTMNDLDLTNSFSSTFTQMDQTVLQEINKSNSNRIVDDQHDIDTKIPTNALPPLPPLTPISKLQTIRKTPTIEQQQQQQQKQQAIPYKNIIHTSGTINLPKSNTILKNVCFVTDDDEVNFVQSNVKLLRQSSKEQTIAPKKSLPHKKRITKKLKSISPNVDQMQTIEPSYQSHHDISHMQRQSHPEQSYSVSNHNHHHHHHHYHHQSETLNLALNAQPIQLTTTHRIEQHNPSANPTEFMPTDQFTNQSDAANSLQAVQMQQMPIAEAQPTIQSSRFACEICGMQAQTQLSFFNHLKLHYEPEVSEHTQDCKLNENIRNTTHNSTNITSTLAMEQNDSHIFQMNDERKLSSNQCIPSQTINTPVIMSDNFVRLQNNEQDFGCISGIGNEDVTDDESMNEYHDSGLTGIKAEQNEFSDTEDMLENGVLDKVQRVVDSYIENGTSDVKNLIDMNENQHHSSLVDGSCNWTTGNAHSLSNGAVYAIDKNDSVGNMNANSFVITATNPNKEATHSAQNQHIIDSQPVIDRPEELTLIYEINMNDKDFPIIDDTSTESILRRQLVRSEAAVNVENQSHFEQIDQQNQKTADIPIDREIPTYISEVTDSTPTKINIQDEFIEEEHTDSDVDPEKPDTQKKKKKIYRCKRCNKICNSKNALHYHFLSHTGERPHKCNECGKSFFASSALKVHKRLHSGDKPYNCDFCNRPFRQWGDLKYHIQSKHSKDRSHQCEFCGKDFARRYSLVIHRRIHTGEKNYKCEFCDKEFRASSYLQVHRKIHTGEKPFVCKVCDKRFRVRGDLKRHSNIHERNKARDIKMEDLSCMSNGSSNGKNEMFIMDDNNTIQSRSTDTLDQLVSVIESTDAALSNENGDESMKKRNFMHIGYDKNYTKTKYKRDFRASETPDDCSSAILDYSTEHLMDRAFDKTRNRHE